MNRWWQTLDSRERRVLLVGMVLSLVLLVYALIWRPFQVRLNDLRQTVAAQRLDLTWMRQAATEVQRLVRVNATAPSNRNGPSLPTLVDQTARASNLGQNLKRVEPQSDGKLRVRLEQVEFDTLIRWLSALQRDHGVGTVNAVLDRQNDSGRVNARLVFESEIR